MKHEIGDTDDGDEGFFVDNATEAILIEAREKIDPETFAKLIFKMRMEIQLQLIKLMILEGTIDSVQEYCDKYAGLFDSLEHGEVVDPNYILRQADEFKMKNERRDSQYP